MCSANSPMMRRGGANRRAQLWRSLASTVIRTAVFPIWTRREHPGFPQFRHEFEQSQFWSPEQIRNAQFAKLKKLLAHVHANCPFYAERMRAAGIGAHGVANFDEFQRLPKLSKRDIQDHGADMMARDFPSSERVRNQTGGSTGSPLQFYVDKVRFDSRMASTYRHDAWAGLQPGDWLAYLWGARLDQTIRGGVWDWLRNELLYRRIELNTSVITDADWQEFVRRCRQKQPWYMIAYAQSAALFARYVREHEISDIKFDSVITTAEVLLPEQRTLIEETFGAEVFERYGCREVSVIASECEYHTGLHVNADALLVEVVPDTSLPAGIGKILITDLLNYSMPLIRYEIGDAASWVIDQKCPCGRGLPLLSRIEGRITDFLLLPDGKRISGPALTLVVADMADVRQVQFVQTSTDSIALRVVPGKGFGPATEMELRKRMRLYLGEKVNLSVNTTSSITSELSGKYRFVINSTGSEVPIGVFDDAQ